MREKKRKKDVFRSTHQLAKVLAHFYQVFLRVLGLLTHKIFFFQKQDLAYLQKMQQLLALNLSSSKKKIQNSKPSSPIPNLQLAPKLSGQNHCTPGTITAKRSLKG